MNVIYVLLPLALVLGGAFVAAFIWATKTGQFEDLETPKHRILLDDDNTNNETQKDGK